MRILVIEDEVKLARFVERGLKEEGYSVDVVGDGDGGLHAAMETDYDLVVLDVMLPGLDGFQVLRSMRKAGRDMRVLMLTALDGVPDRVQGLEQGADDYLGKPFAYAEFLARVKALLRRGRERAPGRLVVADLVLDRRTRQVTRGGRPVSLTVKEYAVLEYLMQRVDEVVSRTALAEHVWDEHYEPMSNTIDVTVYHLRQKVDRGFTVRLVHTIRGAGYCLRLGEAGVTATEGEVS